MQIFYGILAILAGTVILKFNYQLVNFTGRQDWIERKLGSGTTYLAYKLFAIVIVLIGILMITGLSAAFENWLFSPLKRVFNPSQ